MHQRTSQAQALLHTARQCLNQSITFRGKINQFKQVSDNTRTLLPRDTMDACIKFQVFSRGEIRINAEEIWHISNPPLNRGWVLRHFQVVKPDLACVRREQRRQDTQERGFTSTVWANQAID